MKLTVEIPTSFVIAPAPIPVPPDAVTEAFRNSSDPQIPLIFVPIPVALLPPAACRNPSSLDVIVTFEEDPQAIPAAVIEAAVMLLDFSRRRATVLDSIVKGLPVFLDTETPEMTIVPW
jgi:hypothetical protein